MLDAKKIEYRYRDYRQEPLGVAELERLLRRLQVGAADLLRRRDRAFRELGLEGSETDEVLVPLMAKHPTLLERPIGVKGERAVVGRPPERLLELV